MATFLSTLEANAPPPTKNNNSTKTVFLENFNDLRISNAVQAISRLENAANEVLQESEDFIGSIHESLANGKWLDRNDTQSWSKRKNRIRQSIGVMRNCGEALIHCLKALRQKEISTCELERENESLFSNLHKVQHEMSVLQRQLRERTEELSEARRGTSTQVNQAAVRETDLQVVCRTRDLLKKELEGKEKDYERLLTQVRLMNQQLIRCEKERDQMNVELIRCRHQSQLEMEELKTKLKETISQQIMEKERSEEMTELGHQLEELQELTQRLQFQKSLVESENSLLKSKLTAHLQQGKQRSRFSHLKDGRVVAASSYSDDEVESSSSHTRRRKTHKTSQNQFSKYQSNSPTDLIQSTKKSIIVQQLQKDLLYYKDAFLRLSTLMKSVQEEQEKMKEENHRKTEQIKRLEHKIQENNHQMEKSREEHDHLMRTLREKEQEFQNKLQSLQKVKTKEEFDRRELENYLDFIRHSYSVIFKEMSQEL